MYLGYWTRNCTKLLGTIWYFLQHYRHEPGRCSLGTKQSYIYSFTYRHIQTYRYRYSQFEHVPDCPLFISPETFICFFLFFLTRPFTFVCVYVQIPCITLTACALFAGACRSTSWQEMGAPASCSQRTVRDKNAWGKMSTSMTLCLVRCCMDTTTKRRKSTWDRYSKWPSGNLCPNTHMTLTQDVAFLIQFSDYTEKLQSIVLKTPIADIVTNFSDS